LNKKKRGVSPLIATILIIGFTIVLAVLIMTWGSSFVKTLTEKQSKTSNLGLECSKLQFKIDEIKIVNDGLTWKLTNNIDKKIDNLLIQIIKKDKSTEIVNGADISLDPYQTMIPPEPFPLDNLYSTFKISILIPNEDKVRLIPQIKIDDELMTCPIEYSEEKIIEGAQ